MVLLTFAVVWLTPTLGLLVTSFRAPSDIFGSGWWTVYDNLFDMNQYTLHNYIQVINKQGMGRSFINSLVISVPATLISTLIASLAAFALAWMRFVCRNLLFLLV